MKSTLFGLELLLNRYIVCSLGIYICTGCSQTTCMTYTERTAFESSENHTGYAAIETLILSTNEDKTKLEN